MKILISFRHGLGDAVMFTSVLRHLQVHRSNWVVDVATLVGKHSAFHGLCNKVYEGRQMPPCCQYQQKFHLDWHECHTSYADSPSTKAERCLREVFGIIPDPELCRYSIRQGDAAVDLARNYLERVCRSGPNINGRFPVVMIHYEGNTSPEYKNIPTDIIRRLCDNILTAGFTPIILDWDCRTPLVAPSLTGEPSRIYCPDVHEPLWHGTGTGDAESLAALIELSTLMIGVDSGPLHVAGATSTPTLGVWTRHHPIHYFGHASNVLHLIPQNHAELVRGNGAVAEAYFTAHYCHQTYSELEDSLWAEVKSQLVRGSLDRGTMSLPVMERNPAT
ncbi:MAG: hypothetical protein JSS49_13765 [Planctomycetes bacterium]|nr:hypothetical protein [Planctomycetota bacterium]